MNTAEKLAAFERILTMMNRLRAECPWDRKQTFETLRHLTIEETYELADAISDGDIKGIEEEVGDLMLHLVFYAKIGEEQKAFNIATVIHKLCDKMEFRHPHIYGDVEVKDEEEVKRNWEALKLKEGKKSALGGVPRSLEPLTKALRIQEKAKKVGFEWDTKDQVWDKVKEELGELQEAVESGDAKHINEEFGDVLFSLINYARFINVDPGLALETTNKKFIHRFQNMEKLLIERGQDITTLPLEILDAAWDEVKKEDGKTVRR